MLASLRTYPAPTSLPIPLHCTTQGGDPFRGVTLRTWCCGCESRPQHHEHESAIAFTLCCSSAPTCREMKMELWLVLHCIVQLAQQLIISWWFVNSAGASASGFPLMSDGSFARCSLPVGNERMRCQCRICIVVCPSDISHIRRIGSPRIRPDQPTTVGTKNNMCEALGPGAWGK